MNSQKSWYNNHEPAKQWTNKQKGMLIPSAEVQEIYTTTGYKSMLFYQKILCSPNVEWMTDNKLIIRLIRLVKFQVGLRVPKHSLYWYLCLSIKMSFF